MSQKQDVWINIESKNTLFILTNISVVLPNLLQCVDKGLYQTFTYTAEIEN